MPGPQVGLGGGVTAGDAEGVGPDDGFELCDGVTSVVAGGSGDPPALGSTVASGTGVSVKGVGEAARSANSFDTTCWTPLDVPHGEVGDGVTDGDGDADAGDDGSAAALSVGAIVWLEPGVERINGVGEAVASAKSLEAICWAAL